MVEWLGHNVPKLKVGGPPSPPPPPPHLTPPSFFFFLFTSGMHTGLITLEILRVSGAYGGLGHPQVLDQKKVFNLWLQLTGFTDEVKPKVVNCTTILTSHNRSKQLFCVV